VKNKLSDLNDHLFAQLERLSDEDLTPEQITQEAARTESIVAVSEQILRNADIHLKAAAIVANHGNSFAPMLPMIGRMETVKI
jgi:hypothetical protein